MEKSLEISKRKAKERSILLQEDNICSPTSIFLNSRGLNVYIVYIIYNVYVYIGGGAPILLNSRGLNVYIW